MKTEVRVYPTLVFIPNYGTVDTMGVSDDEEFWDRIQKHVNHVNETFRNAGREGSA